jgi:hypothetical protein
MATPYNTLYRDVQQCSDTTANINLAAATALTYTVPGSAHRKYICLFSFPSTSNVYVGYNVDATLPTTGTITGGTNQQLRPSAWYVKGGDILSFNSTAAVTDGSLALYSLPA